MNVLIINSYGSAPDPRAFALGDHLGVAYGTMLGDWCPAWCGSFYSQGAVTFADKTKYERLFTKYGDVYGFDEGYLAYNGPISAPLPDNDDAFVGVRPTDNFEAVTYLDVSDVASEIEGYRQRVVF